jgi:hypothetical protein
MRRRRLGGIERFPEIRTPLRVQPEVGTVAEDTAENKGSIRGYRSPAAAEFIHMLSRKTASVSKISLTDVERFHELFREYLSRSCGLSLCHQPMRLPIRVII